MLGNDIRDIIKNKRLTYRKIASDLGIDHGNLYHSLTDGANPEWRTIERVLDYLGYEIKLAKKIKKDTKRSSK